MAGNDDGERVARERLADIAARVRGTEARGDISIRRRRAGWQGASDLVDTAVELGKAFHLEGHPRQVTTFALEQVDDRVDHGLDVGGRLDAFAHPSRAGQPYAGDRAVTPGDAAPTHGCVELGEPPCHRASPYGTRTAAGV